jgi:hypothetical protein
VPTIGTKRTPPPTPDGTAMTPITKQMRKSASGQNHQGMSVAVASAANAHPQHRHHKATTANAVNTPRLSEPIACMAADEAVEPFFTCAL